MAKDDLTRPVNDLLMSYMRSAGTDTASAIRDVLTELMHVCDHNSLDFHWRVESATKVYNEECALRDAQS